MRKRMLAVLLASVTACSLGGCAGKKKDTVRTVKIGLTLYDQYDTFISELVSWFNASASALEEETGTAINVEVVDAAGSQTTQNEQVKSLIEKGCDVICVNLVDRTEPTTITDMAEKNDVPIIFFNRELVAEDLERWEKLEQYGERIELILANNDDMALGAIDALKVSELPKDEWPIIVGIDGTDVGLGAIKNGEMAGTAYNDKEGQAEAMLKLAFVLSEKDPDSGLTLEDIPLQDEKYVRMPYYRVTLDNVEEYVEWSKKKPDGVGTTENTEITE